MMSSPQAVLHTHESAVHRGAAQYLTFQLGTDDFAFEILSVQEIRGFTPVTPLPGSPSFVLGVMNLRGVIVPVVDLRVRFGLPMVEYTKTSVIIVMNDGHRSVGVAVDVVSDVVTFDVQSESEAQHFERVASQFIDGISRIDERLVVRVSTRAVLSLEDASF